MKRGAYEQANDLVKNAQTIANEIFKHNLGTNEDKMSIWRIQHSIAILARRCADLYGDIGENEKT